MRAVFARASCCPAINTVKCTGDLKLRISKYDVDDLLKIVNPLFVALTSAVRSHGEALAAGQEAATAPAPVEPDASKSLSPTSAQMRSQEAELRAGLASVSYLLKKTVASLYVAFVSRLSPAVIIHIYL